MTSSVTTAPSIPPDLRRRDNAREIARVEAAFALDLDQSRAVVKRRSIGLPSSRDTWVRIEARPYARILLERQSPNGTEAAALLTGIAKPAWFTSTCWNDSEHQLMWRADETTHVAARPVRAGGPITQVPDLDERWWASLTSSLGALAQCSTTRIATPDTLPINQHRISDAVETIYPGRIETRIDAWTTAHADLNWANLTAPACSILDWEDWGTAPRGLDAATLWFNSLSLPDLAKQVAARLHADLNTREGRLCALFLCCQHLAHDPDGEDLLSAPARQAAGDLLSAIGSTKN